SPDVIPATPASRLAGAPGTEDRVEGLVLLQDDHDVLDQRRRIEANRVAGPGHSLGPSRLSYGSDGQRKANPGSQCSDEYASAHGTSLLTRDATAASHRHSSTSDDQGALPERRTKVRAT